MTERKENTPYEPVIADYSISVGRSQAKGVNSMGSIGIGIIYNGCIEEWEGINAAEILTDPLIFFKKISFYHTIIFLISPKFKIIETGKYLWTKCPIFSTVFSLTIRER